MLIWRIDQMDVLLAGATKNSFRVPVINEFRRKNTPLRALSRQKTRLNNNYNWLKKAEMYNQLISLMWSFLTNNIMFTPFYVAKISLLSVCTI